MIFFFQMNRIGHVMMEPKDKSLAIEIKKHFESLNMQSDGRAYIQRDVRTQLDNLGLSAKEIEELEDGFMVVTDLDPWVALHAYGWDAHTIAENGLKAAQV